MKTSSCRAFTLIELLVAASLTVILAGLMVGVSRQMMEIWTKNSGIFSAQAQGRLVLDQITLDLQSALYRDDGRVWLAATVQSDPGASGLWESALRQKPDSGAGGSQRLTATELRNCRYGIAGTWLRFFTVASTVGNVALAGGPAEVISAPMAVSYQIIRHRTGSNPASTDVKYLFYRAAVRAAQDSLRPGTLETGFNLDPAAVGSGYLQPAFFNDGTQWGDPFTVTRPDNPEAVLAENIVDFGLRFYRYTWSGGLERIFPVDDTDTAHLAKTPASLPDASACFPEVIDVMVRVLTDEGARLVAALESPVGRLGVRPAHYHNDAEWWWGLVEANSEVLIRRVVLPAQSR